MQRSPIVIAAAGRGTRMQSYTATMPKHLLPVLGKPFLAFVLDRVREAGFTRIILVAGYHADQLEQFARSIPDPIEVVNQFTIVGPERYGTASAVASVRDLVDGPFVFLNGDNLYAAEDLRILGDLTDDRTYVVGMEHEDPKRFGVLEVASDDRLVRIHEKPEVPPSRMINVGLYRLTPSVFPAIDTLQPSARGEYEITDALNVLATRGEVHVLRLLRYWHDFGQPEDIPRVEQFLRTHGTVPSA